MTNPLHKCLRGARLLTSKVTSYTWSRLKELATQPEALAVLSAFWNDPFGSDGPLSIPEQAVRYLTGVVHAGYYGPNDTMPPERVLADQLGVSKTTIHVALRTLAEQGYVRLRRGGHGGATVTGLQRPYDQYLQNTRHSPTMLRDIIDVRAAIEESVAKRACGTRSAADLQTMLRALELGERAATQSQVRRADFEFHNALAAASRSPGLARASAAIRAELFIPIGLDPGVGHISRSLASHRSIYEAIVRRDAASAAEAVSTHLKETLQRMEVRARRLRRQGAVHNRSTRKEDQS